MPDFRQNLAQHAKRTNVRALVNPGVLRALAAMPDFGHNHSMARPHNSPDVFRAIGHPVRRRMLEMLRKDSLTAAELAQPFRMTHGTVSEHIRALRVAGLIAFRTRKNSHVYTLVLSRLRPIEEWISAFRTTS